MRAKEYGCETIQLFAGNPTAWKMAPPNVVEIEKRAVLAREQSIYPVVIHCAYLVNLATRSPDFHEKSVQLLGETMQRPPCTEPRTWSFIPATTAAPGWRRGWSRLLRLLTGLAKWPDGVKLLLENTAGSGTALGSSFEELARILKSFLPIPWVSVWIPRTVGGGYDFGHRGRG